MATPVLANGVCNTLPERAPLFAVLDPPSSSMAAVLKAFRLLPRKSNRSSKQLDEHSQQHTLRFVKCPDFPTPPACQYKGWRCRSLGDEWPWTGQQPSQPSRSGALSLPLTQWRTLIPTIPISAGGRSFPHRSVSSAEGTSPWPMSWTPARRPLTCGTTPPGTRVCWRSLSTSSDDTHLMECGSVLTCQERNTAFPKTLPALTCDLTSSCGTVRSSTSLNWRTFFETTAIDVIKQETHCYQDLCEACALRHRSLLKKLPLHRKFSEAVQPALHQKQEQTELWSWSN